MAGNGTNAAERTNGPAEPGTRSLSPAAPRSRQARFREADVTRVIKAAQKANLAIAEVRIEPDGAILVIPGTPQAVPSSKRNPWDDA